MSNPENLEPTPEPVRTVNTVPLEESHILRSLLVAGLLGVLLMGMAFNYFILRQLIFTRKDLDVVRPQVSLMVEGYTKNEEPQIRSFVNNLVIYSRTHPDFNPILAKYKIVPDNQGSITPSTGPSATAPVTPATPPKKK